MVEPLPPPAKNLMNLLNPIFEVRNFIRDLLENYAECSRLEIN